MEVKQIEIENIRPYENNPRNNDGAVKSVAESIKRYGFQQPLVVDGDGVIIVGHTRLKAAKKLKLKTVPCIVAEGLSPQQAREYRLVDNKTGELSLWDFEKLELELKDLNFDGFDFAWPSFENEELKEANKEISADELAEKLQHECPRCGFKF